jgi:O-antigen ligase
VSTRRECEKPRLAALSAWLSHLLLFRGERLVAWIGLVVVQNLVSSLFNSHLFDFHEGWIYVLGVGIAGGMSLRASRAEPALKSCSESPSERVRAAAMEHHAT